MTQSSKCIPGSPVFGLSLLLVLFLCSSHTLALEVRNGQFYEGEKQVKLWGVHLTPGLSVAGYETTDAMVPRIQSMGFNAIAIWGISEMFHDGVSETRKGDNSRMDRLDYLIYKCRQAGLYVWFAAASRVHKAKPSDYTRNEQNFIPAQERFDSIRKIQTPNPSSHLAKHALYLDKGLQHAKIRFITQLLNHTNKYTDKAYKDQDGILLYLSDENGFISNAAAVARFPRNRDPYTRQLLENELSNYSNANTAVFKIAAKWHNTLMGHIKSLAPNIPVNLDTTHRTKLFDLYLCKDADFCAYGSGGSQGSGNQSMLWKPPLFSNSNQGSREFKVKGKPWIMYTGNTGASADYRAEWPLRIAAFASFQNADGVFFWNWAHGFRKNKFYSDLPVYDPRLGMDISADEVLLASYRIAGKIFINGYIPPAPSPVTFTFGKKALESWQYGYEWHTTEIFQKLRQASYTTGAEVELDLNKNIKFSQSKPLKQSIENPLVWENPDGDRRVIWDWGKGQLIVDTPEAKAITGFVGKGHNFTNGISLNNVNQNFISFGLISEDNAPIDQSGMLTASLVSQSQNTDFRRRDDGTILNAGTKPTIVNRVSGDLTLAGKTYDISRVAFSGEVLGRQHTRNGKIIFKQEDPVFFLEISPHTEHQLSKLINHAKSNSLNYSAACESKVEYYDRNACFYPLTAPISRMVEATQ